MLRQTPTQCRRRLALVMPVVAVSTMLAGVVQAAAHQDEQAFVVAGDDGSLLSYQDAESIMISVENGEVSVKINGKEIPEDRIRVDDDQVVILDEDGNELRSFTLHIGGGGLEGPWGFRFGDVEGDFPGAFRVPGGEVFEAPKVMIGLHMSTPSAALAKHLRIDADQCTMISGVYEGLPAHKAGLEEYDVIVGIEGADSADSDTIREVLADHEPGDRIRLTVIQAGREHEVSVKLAAYDREALAEAEFLGSAIPPGPFNLWRGAEGEWEARIPGFEHWVPDLNEVFVAPEDDGALREFEIAVPKRRMRLPGRRGQRPNIGDRERSEEDVDARLDRINRRMAELEELLEKLVQQARDDGER